MTFALFLATSVAVAVLWNRFFRPVPWSLTALFLGIVTLYLAPTLLTSRVDVPSHPGSLPYPWKAAGGEPVLSSTGTLFTQIVPWSRVGRDSLRRGEVPLFDRTRGGGSPLLANQQTAIFHPFTLLGLLLPIGKAFTLTAALRLFTLLFFTFVFLRRWTGDTGAVYGAIAYTFAVFHIVMLLFPLGLATMMLPIALAGLNERSFPLLTIGLSLSVLGGHPEQACWVWIAAAVYALYLRQPWRFALGCVAAAALTAFFWLPTVEILPITSRHQAMQTSKADHDLTADWLLPLLWPNVHGRPQDGTYTAPRGAHGIFNDYGEVCGGYAGMLTIILALAAPLVTRRRPLTFAIAVAVLALLTFAEAPLWRDLVRAIPLVGLTVTQRLRFLWVLGLCIAAALAIDALPRLRRVAPLLAVLTFAELVWQTWGYNHPATPRELYPSTGAIRAMQRGVAPYRVAALSWSFLPDTPAFYGLEDVKITDPIQHLRYMWLLRGYLDAHDYDQVIRDTTQPFFDFLNIRYVYAPPDDPGPRDAKFALRYEGADGRMYENLRALPRYFVVGSWIVEPHFGMTVARSKDIRDFRETALVDQIPTKVTRLGFMPGGGSADVLAYGANETRLRVDSRGWSLLVSSDVHWPGWRAYVNGERMPPVTVNGAFLGLWVPPGGSEVRFRYRPRGWDLGVKVSITALVLLAGVASLHTLYRMRA